MGIPYDFSPMGGGSGGGHSWDDFIAYISCNGYSATAETGQALTFYNVSASNFTAYANLPCINMTTSTHYVRLTEESINQGTSMPRSYSAWFAPTSYATGHMRGIAIGGHSSGKELCSPNNLGRSWQICAGGYGQDFQTGVNMTSGRWYHFVQNYYADGTLDLYLDGTRIYHGTGKSFDIDTTTLSIGCPTIATADYYRGYVTAARLWNRTLTDAEILELSKEFTPRYTITANNLSFSLYQKSETYGISYTSVNTPTFEIIEGTLPSTITFNTSTGQFTGKGLTDDDHTYTLKVRVTADNSDPAECTVTISTYKTARISLNSATWDFITEAASSKSISYTSDESISEWSIDSGTLPSGVTFSSGTFTSDGTQTAAESQTVVVRAKSANNQTGVTQSYTLRVVMNVLAVTTGKLTFYADKSATTKSPSYSTTNAITPVWTLSGTLPAGVTFSNGAFTSDPTLIVQEETATVNLTVASSTGCSTPGTRDVQIVTKLVTTIPDDYVFYWSMVDKDDTEAETGQTFTKNGNIMNYLTNTEIDGIQCIHDSQTSYSQGNFTCASDALPSGHNHRSFSWWINLDYTNNMHCFKYGPVSPSRYQWWRQGLGVDLAYVGIDISGVSENDLVGAWHHLCVTMDDTTYCLYKDGALWTSSTTNVANVNTPVGSGNPLYLFADNWSNWQKGAMTALRMYDRVLTAEEISALAAEFTPTAS